MVLNDVFDDQTRPLLIKKKSIFNIASPGDRLLSLFLDFLVFSPIVALLVASELREIRTYLLFDENSMEANLVWVLFLVGVLCVSIFLQTLFLRIWSGTPGQIFLHLRVIPIQTYHMFENPESEFIGQAQLSLSQCFLRSVSWWLCAATFFLPFMEIFSHPLRRSIHDRASDTIVVSLKREKSIPQFLEKRFFSQIMASLSIAGMFLVVVTYFKIYSMVRQGHFKKTELIETGEFCDLPMGDKLTHEDRLDTLLALHFLNVDTKNCIQKEVDFALWKVEPSSRSMAFLIESQINDDKDKRNKYLKEVCRIRDSESACQMSQYFLGDLELKKLQASSLQLKSQRVLLLKSYLEQRQWKVAAVLMEEFLEDQQLRMAVQSWYVRMAWQLSSDLAHDNKIGENRKPASVELQDFLQKFKDRYEIP